MSAEADSHVLPFGCARTQKMYRALVPGPTPHYSAKAKLVTIPTCPGCGAEHSVSDSGSFARRYEPGDVIDVSLAGYVPAPTDEPPAVPPLLTHDRGNTKVSDAELLAAIPTDEPVNAADIARHLALRHTFTMIKRVEYLNARAIAAWGKPLARIIRTQTGRRPILLQRFAVDGG
jgi:hypothetical protein